MTVLTWMVGLTCLLIGTRLQAQFFGFSTRRDNGLTWVLLFVAEADLSVFLAGAISSLNTLTVSAIELAVCVLSSLPLLYHGRRHGAGHPPQRLEPSSWKSGIMSLGWLGWLSCALLLGLLALSGFVGWLLPPYGSDELSYHLLAVANWIHTGRLQDTPISLWANVYPKNAELLYTWFYLVDDTDHWVHLGPWLFAVAGVLATMGCAREMGIERPASIACGVLFLAGPTVFLQSTTAYTDLAFTSVFLLFFYFYLRLLDTFDLRWTCLCGLSAGLTLGTKSSAMLYVGTCALVMLVFALRGLRQGRLHGAQLAKHIAVFTGMCVLFGSYWYVHTWATYGNPIYPFTVAFRHHVVFPGQGSMQEMIINPNTPEDLQHKSWLDKVWISWTTIPNFYSYDMYVGGFGPQWTFAEFPCLVILPFLWRVRNRFRLWTVMVPLGLIFLLQPANWWARYTLFMAAWGAWACMLVVGAISWKTVRRGIHFLLLLSVAGLYVGGVVYLFSHAGGTHESSLVSRTIVSAVRTPEDERTVGLVFPEYAWVDHLQRPAVIGYTEDVPFPYALFGEGARNSLISIETKDYDTFLSILVHRRIQYLMTGCDNHYERWIQQRPSLFRKVYARSGYRVYRVEFMAEADLGHGD
ncbi:ArnT family glycosyltransferase [Alicyclobacillus herbarius]|uniref:ArnT family glycosyltransferase n=1 Tax=Alicyclobacillus herbarius TaxID=122960 RepID=UPI000402B2E1|nr:glycosyltransferase family 39 protein [Alicyclobacillus herbarius]